MSAYECGETLKPSDSTLWEYTRIALNRSIFRKRGQYGAQKYTALS